MRKVLVIVESPAKARTIERILKDGYDVRASYGHVRDLPESADEIPDEIRKKKWGRLGVDTDGDFTPYYVIPNDKRKYVQALKTALKGASEVFLKAYGERGKHARFVTGVAELPLNACLQLQAILEVE